MIVSIINSRDKLNDTICSRRQHGYSDFPGYVAPDTDINI